MTADGKHLIGLGTDVGGMAMCYRRDLFEKAGLPTERDAVSKLWPTWHDYVEVGEQFKQGHRRDGLPRRGTNTYNTILVQSRRRRGTPTSTPTTSSSSTPTRPSSRRGTARWT